MLGQEFSARLRQKAGANKDKGEPARQIEPIVWPRRESTETFRKSFNAMSELPEKTGVNTKLAWVSLACGILGWVLAPFIPFGLDVVAVVTGSVALRRTNKDAKRERLIAHFGLWLGIAKIFAMCLLMIWIIVAFMLNPVAH